MKIGTIEIDAFRYVAKKREIRSNAAFKAWETRRKNKAKELRQTNYAHLSPQQWAWHPDNPNSIPNRKK